MGQRMMSPLDMTSTQETCGKTDLGRSCEVLPILKLNGLFNWVPVHWNPQNAQRNQPGLPRRTVLSRILTYRRPRE